MALLGPLERRCSVARLHVGRGEEVEGLGMGCLVGRVARGLRVERAQGFGGREDAELSIGC